MANRDDIAHAILQLPRNVTLLEVVEECLTEPQPIQVDRSIAGEVVAVLKKLGYTARDNNYSKLPGTRATIEFSAND